MEIAEDPQQVNRKKNQTKSRFLPIYPSLGHVEHSQADRGPLLDVKSVPHLGIMVLLVRASSAAITLEGNNLWILVLGKWDHKSLNEQLQYFGRRTKCAVGQQKGIHEHWVWDERRPTLLLVNHISYWHVKRLLKVRQEEPGQFSCVRRSINFSSVAARMEGLTPSTKAL